MPLAVDALAEMLLLTEKFVPLTIQHSISPSVIQDLPRLCHSYIDREL